jgi:hypothetical protein
MDQFQITDEAKKVVIKHLSEDGLLDLRISRVSANKFQITGEYDNVTVLSFPQLFSIYNGDALTLTGLKMVLDIE